MALTDEAFAEHTAAGRCVAVPDQRLQERSVAAAAEVAAAGERLGSRCVTTGAWFDLLLDSMEARAGTLTLGQGAVMTPPEESELMRAGGARTLFEALSSARELRRQRDDRDAPERGLVARLRRLLRR